MNKQECAIKYITENYLEYNRLRHDIVSDKLQVRVAVDLESSESCRMVQNGVESSSAENTMLHNATQPLHNATQLYTTATQLYTTATQLYTTATQCYTTLFDVPAEGRGEFMTTAQISERLVTYGNIKKPMALSRLGMVLGAAGYQATRPKIGGRLIRGWLVYQRDTNEITSLKRLLKE